MELTLQTIPRGSRPSAGNPNTVYLVIDHWNDFSFVTMFQVVVCDESGQMHELGSVKIGFSGQTTEFATYKSVNFPVRSLPDKYFSLGTDVGYYSKIRDNLKPQFAKHYYEALKDVVYNPEIFEIYSGEIVFQTSLMRDSSISAIRGQYARIMSGGVELTEFDFTYIVEQSDSFAGYELQFKVVPESKPPTNVHAVIGRNGVGKTSLLNDIIRTSLILPDARGQITAPIWLGPRVIQPDYFSGVISVSFSAFDPFKPPKDRPEPSEGPFYHYIGIKDPADESGQTLKSTADLQNELVASISYVLSEPGRAARWRDAIETLESDTNFRDIDLQRFVADRETNEELRIQRLAEKLSSGHAIVLLTITKLVCFVQEKTLVLIDEPECHLHPPLLSAFTRCLSNLLHNRNGVALIATHSPVVLQEIPSSCAWKLVRSKNRVNASRPNIETFAENVGTLTREVFGLEVSKSGFHVTLAEEVENGKSYDQIMHQYDGQIGLEGQVLLNALIAVKGRE